MSALNQDDLFAKDGVFALVFDTGGGTFYSRPISPALGAKLQEYFAERGAVYTDKRGKPMFTTLPGGREVGLRLAASSVYVNLGATTEQYESFQSRQDAADAALSRRKIARAHSGLE